RETGDDSGEPLRIDRLEQVVERLERERVRRILGVSSDEDDGGRVGVAAQEPRRVEARRAGQLDVEEDCVTACGELRSLRSTRSLPNHLHAGMCSEQVP